MGRFNKLIDSITGRGGGQGEERKGMDLVVGVPGGDRAAEELVVRRRCTTPNRRVLPCRTTFSLPRN